MAEEPNVCKQLHLPVQSGHDRTLKRMLRRYTVAEYLEKIAWVREAIPGIALSTDVIVAFPGETEEEYEATLDLMREVRFDDAFLYKYSLRDGTPATRLAGEQFVPDEVAQRRLERLIALHREIQARDQPREVGTGRRGARREGGEARRPPGAHRSNKVVTVRRSGGWARTSAHRPLRRGAERLTSDVRRHLLRTAPAQQWGGPFHRWSWRRSRSRPES
jgi:tRNA-2-methylthio-N6-dimethylallyladenosine synthase